MLHSFYPIVPDFDWLKRLVGLGAKCIQLRIKDVGEDELRHQIGQRSRELNVVLSAARRQAEEIKGDADAQAANIYAEAYTKDPEFYEFWKAIEAYRTLMPRFRKTLTTDAEFFKYLYSQEGTPSRP